MSRCDGVVAAVAVPSTLPMSVKMREALGNDEKEEEEEMKPGKSVTTLEAGVVNASAADVDEERPVVASVKRLNGLFRLVYGAPAEEDEVRRSSCPRGQQNGWAGNEVRVQAGGLDRNGKLRYQGRV
jgi:hypothetical protein